jgi:putative acetyltransferase
MRIRNYTDVDLPAVADLFADAVHRLAVDHYDEAQREAWAPRAPRLDWWRQRLAPLKLLLAEEDLPGTALMGFIGYEDKGHIDLMFTSPDAARQGVASTLFTEAQARLFALGVRRLSANASLLGRPFFERQGFVVEEEQTVMLRGSAFRRFAMAKRLD